MQFKTHVLFALLIGIIYISIFHNVNKFIFIPLVLIFSALPDIDHPQSYISHKLPLLSHIINFFFKHRGFFHSIFPPIILGTILFYLNFPNVAIALLVGYFAHLAGDALTVQGINFLHPISTFEIRGPIHAGSFSEFIIFIILIALNGFFIYTIL